MTRRSAAFPSPAEVYALTGTGRAVLAEMVVEWTQFEAGMRTILGEERQPVPANDTNTSTSLQSYLIRLDAALGRPSEPERREILLETRSHVGSRRAAATRVDRDLPPA